MKKLITILLLFGVAYGQLPIKRGPTSILEQDAHLQAYVTFIIPVYADTTAANVSTVNKLGSLIQLKTGVVYFRDTSANAHRWTALASGSLPSLPLGQIYVGTLSGVPLAIIPGGDLGMDINGNFILNSVNPNVYPSNTFLKGAPNGKGLWTSATPVTQADLTNLLPASYYFNGLTLSATSDTVYLGGTLTKPTKLTASSTNLFGVDFGTDATGDIFYRASNGYWARLAIGGTNTVLHGGTIPSYSSVVEGDLSFTDITTNNASTSKHGLLPKLSNNAAQYLDGTGNYSVPTGTVISAANPTASVGTSAVNGSATTFMRSDAAPPISLSIVPTWSGIHTFTLAPVFSSTTASLPLKVDASKNLTSGAINLSGSEVTGALPTAKGGLATGGVAGTVSTKNSATDYDVSFLPNEDVYIAAAQALGSQIKATSVGGNFADRGANNSAFGSGVQKLVAVYVRTAATITGVMWVQITQGSYTADNTNVVGLYTYSAGTLTLVASSTDDGTIWKAAANTVNKKAFSSTYNAAPGLYFIGMLYHSSAQTTAPAIGSYATLNSSAENSFDFTNSACLNCTLNSRTSLITSSAISAFSVNGNTPCVGLY